MKTKTQHTKIYGLSKSSVKGEIIALNTYIKNKTVSNPQHNFTT